MLRQLLRAARPAVRLAPPSRSASSAASAFPSFLTNIPATEVTTLSNGVRVASEVRASAPAPRRAARSFACPLPVLAPWMTKRGGRQPPTAGRLARCGARVPRRARASQRQPPLSCRLPAPICRAATARRPRSASSSTRVRARCRCARGRRAPPPPPRALVVAAPHPRPPLSPPVPLRRLAVRKRGQQWRGALFGAHHLQGARACAEFATRARAVFLRASHISSLSAFPPWYPDPLSEHTAGHVAHVAVRAGGGV